MARPQRATELSGPAILIGGPAPGASGESRSLGRLRRRAARQNPVNRLAVHQVPVLDASAVVEYLADGPHARAVGDRLTAGQELWAPHLIDAEVGNVLRRGVALGAISPEGGRAALRDLSELPLNRAVT